MGSGQSQSTTSTSQPAWAQAVGQKLLGAESNQVFNQLAQGYPQNLNQQVAPLNASQRAGMANMRGAATGSLTNLSNSANNLAMNTMNGQYLNPSSNPMLQNYFNAAAQPLVAQYQTATAPGNMAAAQQAGMFNSNASADQRLMSQYSLGNNLQSLAANIYEPAYQFERGAQMQTQQMLPTLQQGSLLPGQTQFGLGSINQQQQQAQMNAQRQNALSAFQMPYQLFNQLGAGIGQATSGASNVVSTSPGASGK
ncbi:MAG TPA: hypothetical protein VMU16_00600 [Candidatus Binataceae bacterium]|nr:hypothetical protein [Candidatus Binataceae bacterium]